jgi:hypothetical protein
MCDPSRANRPVVNNSATDRSSLNGFIDLSEKFDFQARFVFEDDSWQEPVSSAEVRTIS